MAGGGGMFSFSDDVLGLGKLDDGSGGTAECGSRPSCFGGGSVCQQKRDSYDQCVANALQTKKEIAIETAKINARNGSSGGFGKIMSKKTKIIIAVAAVVVLILILKKR